MHSKKFLIILACCLVACNQEKSSSKQSTEKPPIEQSVESTLLCDAKTTSIIKGLSRTSRSSYTIKKTAGKVVEVKSEYYTYTPAKSVVRTDQEKYPVYAQLLEENDKLILRLEVTVDHATYDTEIYKSGRYRASHSFSWEEGTCRIGESAF
jgi:hypothetical protein